MKTSVAEVGRNKVRLEVEVPEPDVRKLIDRTYKRLAGEIRVPGFRPGRVPKPIIDQRLGRDFVRQETLKDSLPELFAEAVESADLDVVAPPELEVKEFDDGGGLTFEAIVEVRPIPELKDYRGLPVDRPTTDVTDDEVGEQVEHLRVRYSTLEPVPRPARSGDFALIDLRTYRHDETIEALTQKDLLVEVGAGMVVPELDTELEGKRTGEILRFTTTLPERFEQHAGWQVGMQVLVKEVKARNLPELDDELAKTVSEFDTLGELRDDLRERIARVKTSRADEVVRERTIDAFLDRGLEVDLPEGMVALEVDRLITQLARVLESQDATLQQYVEAENLDVDSLRQRFREQAERNLSVRLGLEAVARTEGIEVTPEDRDSELALLAERTGRTTEEVRHVIDHGGNWESLDGDIIRSKALDLLVGEAEIKQEGSA